MSTGERLPLTAQSLVADVLARGSEIALLFLDWRTECVGCSLVRFCTLEDVSRYYGLDLDDMLNQIQERMETNGSHASSSRGT